MDPITTIMRPDTFEPGGNYLWLQIQAAAEGSAHIPVRFIKYDPCPAFILVGDDNGKKWRCPRDELFIYMH